MLLILMYLYKLRQFLFGEIQGLLQLVQVSVLAKAHTSKFRRLVTLICSNALSRTNALKQERVPQILYASVITLLEKPGECMAIVCICMLYGPGSCFSPGGVPG